MGDHRIDQLRDLAKLVKNKKKLKEVAGELDKDLLDSGFYAYNDGNGIHVKEFKHVQDILDFAHKLKEDLKGNYRKPVKLKSHQVQELQNLIVASEDEGLKVAFEKAKTLIDEKEDIRGVSLAVQSAAKAYATFEASWAGISAEVGLESNIKVGIKGKYVEYQAGLEAKLKGKLQLGLGGISAEAEAVGEASHEFKVTTAKIGNTDYSLAFFSKISAFAEAKAQFSVGLGIPMDDESSVLGVKVGAYAGFGVAGQIGIQLMGKYTTDKERMLASADVEVKVKLGIGTELSSAYTATNVDIDGSAYSKHDIDLGADLGIGASLTLSVIVLAEIEKDLTNKILENLKKVAIKIFRKDIFKAIGDKYEKYKTEVFESLSDTWDVIYSRMGEVFGQGDNYKVIHKRIKEHLKDLSEELGKMNQSTDETIVKRTKKLNKAKQELEDYFEKHSTLIQRLDNDLKASLDKIQEIQSAKDTAKAISDNIDDIEKMIELTEEITMAKIELAEAAHKLQTGEEHSKAIMALNIALNEILDAQELATKALTDIVEKMKDCIMTFKD